MANPLARPKVFLAAPMSSLEPNSVDRVRAELLAVVEALKGKQLEVYSALSLAPPYEPADAARKRVEAEMATTNVLIFVYPSELPTSALVEAGMALALRKRILLFVRNRVNLPFLLQEIAHETGCREERFETYAELRDKIVQHWDAYVQ